MFSRLFVLLGALSVLPLSSVAEEVGLFADFSTSSGEFTVLLNYEAAPRTVSNFVGLAEGTRPWVDPLTGMIREDTPFYNGLIFHRVIEGFVIQGGCPLGNGQGGPGYRFRDEVDNGLIHLPYVISMANSGPNTNGSQFFITVMARSHLDGVHTVFGEVVSGQSVIDMINQTETDSNDSPVSPVLIESIIIRRVGPGAEAFTGESTELATVAGVSGSLRHDSESGNLTFHVSDGKAPTYLQVFTSTNLQDWTQGNPGYAANSLWKEQPLDLGTLAGQRVFFNLVRVDYTDRLPSTVDALGNATLSFNWGSQNLFFEFDSSGLIGTGGYFNGESTEEIEILETINNSELWDGEWILVNNPYAPFGILGVVGDFSGNTFRGKGELYQFNQTTQQFQFIDSGTFELILP